MDIIQRIQTKKTSYSNGSTWIADTSGVYTGPGSELKEVGIVAERPKKYWWLLLLLALVAFK